MGMEDRKLYPMISMQLQCRVRWSSPLKGQRYFTFVWAL